MITLQTFLIVCPFVFLAGMIDAIGGGGGLISLPAYLIAGLPSHYAVATNKLSSSCGTALATARFIKEKLVDIKLAIPTIIASLIGAFFGAKLSLLIPEKYLMGIMIIILPIVALLILRKNAFIEQDVEITFTKTTYIGIILSSFIIGMYDGFYGPGTGTFLIIAFTFFAKLEVKKANAQAKVINLTTNITSLIVFLFSGKIVITLGIVAAICNMIGGYIGAGMVLKSGAKIVKPSILFVMLLLGCKVIGIY